MEENIINQLNHQKKTRYIKGYFLLVIILITLLSCYFYHFAPFFKIIIGLYSFFGIIHSILIFNEGYNLNKTAILDLEGMAKILAIEKDTRIIAKSISKWLLVSYPKLAKILVVNSTNFYSMKIIALYKNQKRNDFENAEVDEILKSFIC